MQCSGSQLSLILECYLLSVCNEARSFAVKMFFFPLIHMESNEWWRCYCSVNKSEDGRETDQIV